MENEYNYIDAIDAHLDERLNSLAKLTNKPKSFLIREALIEFMENLEDLHLALKASEEYQQKGASSLISHEELGRELGFLDKKI